MSVRGAWGRRLAVYGAVMAVTLVAGLGMRFGSMGLPGFVVKFGGSTMWALMIYWVLALVLRDSGPGRVMGLAGVVATAVEFFKLYRTPPLDAFRGTLPGILLLGKYFSVWDIVAYWAAIGVGAGVDHLVLRRRVRQRGAWFEGSGERFSG